MQVVHDNNTVQTNIEETSSFKIEASAKAFKVISSQIYKYKVKAIVRELWCNAWDAQREAGTLDKQAEINLPDHIRPEFSIRDYGTGLSEADVYAVYTSYFTSTKTSNNEDIGGFGLGSKTPFSYTDSFTVTSYYEGVSKVYSMFIDDSGKPNVAKLGEAPTTEANGLKVALAVVSDDFYEFEKCLKETTYFFDEKPKVLNNSKIELIEDDFGNDVINIWERYSKKHHVNNHFHPVPTYYATGVYLVMGNVAYPVEPDHVDFGLSHLEGLTIFVNVPIGSVELAPSREVLDYSKTTVSFLKDIKEYVTEEENRTVKDSMAKAINDFPAWEDDLTELSGLIQHLEKNLNISLYYLRQMLKGMTTSPSAITNITKYPNYSCDMERYKVLSDGTTVEFNLLFHTGADYKNHPAKDFEYGSYTLKFDTARKIVIVPSDSKTSYIQRIDQGFPDYFGMVICVKCGDMLDSNQIAEVSKLLFNTPCIDINTLPKPVRKIANSYVNLYEVANSRFSLNASYSDYRCHRRSLESIIEVGGFYSVRETSARKHTYVEKQWFKDAHDLGVYEGISIVHVTKKDSKYLEQDPNWWELEEYTRETFDYLKQKHYTVSTYKDYMLRSLLNHYQYNMDTVIGMEEKSTLYSVFTGKVSQKVMYQFSRSYRRAKANYTPLSKKQLAIIDLDIALGNRSLFKKGIYARSSLDTLTDILSRAKDLAISRYPLMSHIDHYILNRRIPDEWKKDMLIDSIEKSSKWSQTE